MITALLAALARTTTRVVPLSQAVQKSSTAATNTAAPTAAPAGSTRQPSFMPATQFAGARAGFAFRQGPQGLGYYHEDGFVRARPSRAVKGTAVAPADGIAAEGAAKQPTDAASAALLQTVSAIGQSAAAAIWLTTSVAGQMPAARPATKPATAAVPPAARRAAVHEQPSSRATAFDHSSRTAAVSPLRGHSAAGATSSAATAPPLPPPVHQAAVLGGGAAMTTASAETNAGSRQEIRGVVSGQPPSVNAEKDISRRNSGAKVDATTATAALRPAKGDDQSKPSATAVVSARHQAPAAATTAAPAGLATPASMPTTTAVPGLPSAITPAASRAGPTPNGNGPQPELDPPRVKLSGPSAVEPSASHVWARSGAVAAQAAERTAAAGPPSSSALTCGDVAQSRPRVGQPPGLAADSAERAIAGATEQPPAAEAPAGIGVADTQASHIARAAAAAGLAAACGDTAARAENSTAVPEVAASAWLANGKQRVRHRKLTRERKLRSAEEVEAERVAAVLKAKTQQRNQGLEVRLARRLSSENTGNYHGVRRRCASLTGEG